MTNLSKVIGTSLGVIVILGTFTWIIIESNKSEAQPSIDPQKIERIAEQLNRLEEKFNESIKDLQELKQTSNAQSDTFDQLKEELADVKNQIKETQKIAAAQTEAKSDKKSDSPNKSLLEGIEDNPELEEKIATLLDPNTNFYKRYPIWQELAKNGWMDETIKFFEVRAKENPQDAEAQSDLGDAYIQKIFTVPDPEKGIWSMKANASYDKALSLDNTHWSARFSKAVNFSHAPPIYGLQSKAIEQFEILLGQQEQVDPQPHFSQTYELLGNLYDSKGNKEKAKEIWQRGVKMFPDNQNLKGKLNK